MADFCGFSRAAFSAKTKAGRQLASATFAKDSPQVKKGGYGQWRIPAVLCEVTRLWQKRPEGVLIAWGADLGHGDCGGAGSTRRQRTLSLSGPAAFGQRIVGRQWQDPGVRPWLVV